MKKKFNELSSLEVLDDYELEEVVRFLQKKLDRSKEERAKEEPKLIEYIRIDEGSEGAFIKLGEWDKVDPIDLKNFLTDCLNKYDDSFVSLHRYTIFEDELEDRSDVEQYDWFGFNDEIDISRYER